MTNEKIINQQIFLQETKKALLKNGFEVAEAKNKAEAMSLLRDLIPSSASIGVGGSRTLEQIGFYDVFHSQNYPHFLDRNAPGLTEEQKTQLQKKSLTADFFVCSANALTLDGQLIFIDYNGNRNAAATYGPEKRVFVIGCNKIEINLENGLSRASQTAGVLNNIRFNTSNPCAKKGYCLKCDTPQKLCRVTTIISRCQPEKSALVILVQEELGF